MSVSLKLMCLCVVSSRAPGEDTLNGKSHSSFYSEVKRYNLYLRLVLFFLSLLSVLALQPPSPSTRPDTPSWGPERTVSHQKPQTAAPSAGLLPAAVQLAVQEDLIGLFVLK